MNDPKPRILVTGSRGFFGIHVVNVLKAKGYYVYPTQPDLLIKKEITDWFRQYKPDYCIHLAAHTGGIIYNSKYPDDLFYDNTMMSLNLLNHLSTNKKLVKCLSVITSCSMPDGLADYKESLLHAGQPNPSVEFFAYAKRNVEIYGRALNKIGKNRFATACVTNLFGPGDSADLDKTKVVGAMIIKMLKAQKEGVDLTLFGDGTPVRDFLYVADAAQYLVDTLFLYEDYDKPLNIGSGTEISIKQLAETVKQIVGFEGKILWDTTKQNGQHRKTLNVERMRSWLDVYNTPFEDALRNTVAYYRDKV